MTGGAIMPVNLNILCNTSLYHGTSRQFEVPNLAVARKQKDFGAAFYCTIIYEQAARWATRTGKGYINLYHFIPSGVQLNTIKFNGYSMDWLNFIACCRNGVAHNYDIIDGPVADDQIYDYISDYLNGRMKAAEFMDLARFRGETHQVAFCTERAIQCLQFKQRRLIRV